MSDVADLQDIPSGMTLVSVDELARLRGLAELISDLDRCTHGRLRGTTCINCDYPGNRSPGNFLLRSGQHIGTTIHGDHIVVPPSHRRNDPKAWRRAGR